MKIEANALKKTFGKKKVIKDVSIRIKDGEMVGLLGKNGAGKTVLMNILAGLIVPTSGEVKYNRTDIERNIQAYWEKINWASGYQSLQLQASIQENMETFAGIYGISKNKIEEILDLVEMNEIKLKKRKLFLLSSGEIGRVNLAKSLLNKPDILFLDEPTAFLDPVFKVKFKKILEKINNEWGTTIIFSSHQLDEIIDLCDKVVILRDGEVSYDGKRKKFNELIKYY